MNEADFYQSEIDGLKWGMIHMPNVPPDVIPPRKCYEPLQFTQVERIYDVIS